MALNLQTVFLTPPMAMSAYYLKGIAPPEVRLTQIFAGVMPFLFCVIVSMVLMYVFPQIVFYLPELFYGELRQPPDQPSERRCRACATGWPAARCTAERRWSNACLARIAAREPEVQAWAWFDPEFARGAGQDARRAPPRGPRRWGRCTGCRSA